MNTDGQSMNHSELLKWAKMAGRKESAVYYEGFLGFDRFRVKNLKRVEPVVALRKVSDTALALQWAGFVELVQKRHFDGMYDYIAQRTGKHWDAEEFAANLKRKPWVRNEYRDRRRAA